MTGKTHRPIRVATALDAALWLALAAGLGACDPGGGAGVDQFRSAAREASESAYRAPPSL
ncbi:MAG: hypothetical protein H0X27_14555, partial [Caulobacteraceae bacterium]|nr:hypothetical protein [Caulobacteraceae bacterium]